MHKTPDISRVIEEREESGMSEHNRPTGISMVVVVDMRQER